MTKPILKVLAAGFIALLASAAFGRDAVVLKITGNAQMQPQGQTTWMPLAKDSRVAVGATIKTDAGAEVYLEVLNGAVATIKGNSTVRISELKEGALNEAELDVSDGATVVSTLNPRLKNVNNYKVKTPLGVAAARGTVFSVRVVPGGNGATTIGTMAGTIIIESSRGTITLPYGQAVTTAGQASLAAAIRSDPGLANDIADAVKVVAENVKAATSAVDSPPEVTSTLAAVVSAASAALPNQASAFVETAVSAVVSSTSVTGNSASTATGVTNNAVSAITEAAVRSAPTQTTSIVEKAASAVVETKVTEAVNQAKATGGNTTTAATQATANAQATLQSVAQAAVTATGNTNTSSTIAAAVNTGASTGARTAGTTTGATVAPPAVVTPPTSTTPSATVPATPTTPVTPVDPTVRNVSPSN